MDLAERPAAAARLAPVAHPDGTAERTGFWSTAGGVLFGAQHLPAATARAGVVVCPPLPTEHQSNYRKEVLLGRALARDGFAVQRIHYRGTGNSETVPLTLETMVADSHAAAELLRAEIGRVPIVMLGTLPGALAAAAAAPAADVSALVLWQPVLRGQTYLRSLLRARAVADLRAGGRRRAIDELERRGAVEVMGFLIQREMYDSIVDVELLPILRRSSCPVLLVQLARSSEPSTELRGLERELQDGGRQVELRCVETLDAWWYVQDRWEPEEQRTSTLTTIETTAGWLRSILGAA